MPKPQVQFDFTTVAKKDDATKTVAVVLVTGSREWKDYATTRRALREFARDTSTYDRHVLIHGAARGADHMAGAVAVELFGHAWEIEVYPVNAQAWQTIGKAAGHRRNACMIQRAQLLGSYGGGGYVRCLAFWDGASKGTRDCLGQATRAGIATRVYPPGYAERA